MQFQDTKFKELDSQGLITDKLQQIDEFEANFRPVSYTHLTLPTKDSV